VGTSSLVDHAEAFVPLGLEGSVRRELEELVLVAVTGVDAHPGTILPVVTVRRLDAKIVVVHVAKAQVSTVLFLEARLLISVQNAYK